MTAPTVVAESALGAIPVEPVNSYAVPDVQVAPLIIGRALRPQAVSRLRRQGRWPMPIYINGKAFVLRSDIERFLIDAQRRSVSERAARSEQVRRILQKRWRGAEPVLADGGAQ